MQEANSPRQMEGHQADPDRDGRFLEFYQQQTQRYDLSEGFLRSFAYRFAQGESCFEAAPEIAEIPFLRGLTFWILRENLNVSEDIASNLILAFEEVVANVVRHSYEASDTKWLETRLYCEDALFKMELLDRGEGGRDPELLELLDSITKTGRPPLQRRGGLGLYLMKRIMDEMTYEPGETNTLRMTKQLGETK